MEQVHTAALEAEDLSCSIGGAAIVAGVTMAVRPGEFVAVIGPNGAGKTSLFNLFSGLLPATRGSVRLAGRDVTALRPSRRARAGLGRTFQTSSVFPALTAAENVRLGAQAAAGGSLRVWQRAGSGPATRTAAEALERVGLAGRRDALGGSLSHGDKRKLELAILLATDPVVILLDEPMAGVSAEDVPGLKEVIRSVHRDQGRTVLMVEHHMDVVLDLADRVAVMHHGSLLALDEPDRVMADATVQEAYLGEPL